MATLSLTLPGSLLAATRPTPVSQPRPQVDSRTLLQGAREVIIRHGDQEYRLLHTRNDKLILTK